MEFALFAPLAALVPLAAIVFGLYWIIRLAVRHAIRDTHPEAKA